MDAFIFPKEIVWVCNFTEAEKSQIIIIIIRVVTYL